MFKEHGTVLAISVVLFLVIYGVIITIKPSLIFYGDGSIREFGVGYTNKTIVPIWLASILIGALSYLLIMYITHT
jgi:uncharacterized membrane protein YozB (DUF420 family)